MSIIINTAIILDDAFKGAIVVNGKTGDKWVNLSQLQGPHIYQNANKKTTELKVAIAERKEVGTYGDTHSVSLQQAKEQKGQPKVYCGSAKAFTFSQNSTPAAQPTPPPITADDLPF